jgi:PhnB protein
MAIKQLNPYLQFNGNASEAIELYQTALGAKVEARMTFADAPGMNQPEHPDRIMHSALRIGPNVLMVSDTMPNQPTTPGGLVDVCLDFDDAADQAAKFEALAAGGKVTVPLQDTFWGARFGTLTDRFGVRWMFNCMLPQAT